MLSVEAVDLKYGEAQILRSVSLSAEPGRVTCILGRNGVGKTSLLKAIVGHHPPSRGRIAWEGRDVTRLRPEQRARAGMAYVPQGREIFPLLTVRENLECGLAAAAGSRQHVPEAVFDLFPVLKTMLGRRGGDLSGGQQQQLAIARAMTASPRLLVLDEPTEGIQPSVIKEIGRVIRQLRDTGTIAILLVEQYFDFARDLADRYFVMDRGEVVLSGSADEVAEDDVRRHMTV